ncbi:MAG: glycosyltransferase [Lachnospiraceae bacterium]|nr:glycosyltransferase [Lachnospiraceae bacterium]
MDQNIVTLDDLMELYLPLAPVVPSSVPTSVDIIVAVYNGMDLLLSLLASIEQTKVPYRLFLINDCSTDSEVTPFLTSYAVEHKNTVILQNPHNMGYIRSINQVLPLCTQHVILLNTDVVLPKNWLERMVAPLLTHPDIASVTPFTNAGTICSFPVQFRDNPLFAGLSMDEIDQRFSMITPHYPSIPTGVGFCMALNHEVLTKIGLYNEKDYEQAYGEENDWCQRAIRAGYRNVIADNLFVYHKHHGSYDKKKVEATQIRNTAMLKKKFPSYFSDVDHYIKHNPNEHLIRIMTMLCSCNDSRYDSFLIFNHALGGGASIFLKTQIEKLLLKGSSLIVITPNKDGYLLQYIYRRYYCEYPVTHLSSIFRFARLLHIRQLVINELVSYPKPYKLLASIKKLKEDLSCNMIYYVHDFYCICPGITLSKEDGYCHLPALSECRKCPFGTFSLSYLTDISIEEWRMHWHTFLLSCDTIVTFSQDSTNKLHQIYPDLFNIECTPHQVDYVTPVKPSKKAPDSPLVIGILGLVTKSKGAAILRDMIALIAQGNLNIKIVLIGRSSVSTTEDCYYEHGFYNKKEVSKLTEQYQIDVFFFPFISPETFSFATEEAIKTTLPVAVFDVGAPAERIRTYPRGILIPTPSAACALQTILEYIKTNGRE